MNERIYSVIAVLDAGSTQKFLSLRNSLSAIEGSYNNTVPHITISVYDKKIDLDELIRWTKKITERHIKFKILYSTVGVFFGSNLIAVPSFSKRLYSLYEDHHQKFDDCCRDYSALKTGEWFPHTGIWYTNKETACMNIGKLAEMFQVIEAEVIALRITEFDYNTFTEITEYQLLEPDNVSLNK